MKNNILHIFFLALAALLCLNSCALEEPTDTPQNSDGYIEFVARPTSYSKQDVTTKGDGNLSTFDDDEIHNAFLIIFDAQGRKLLCDEIDENLSVKVDRGLGNVTPCILANVPIDFAYNIIGTTNPSKGTNDNKYLDTAVLDFTYAPYESIGILGVPVIDLDSDNGREAPTPAVPCIPMFGIVDAPIDLTSAQTVIEISLQRLFAKISVTQKMDMELSTVNLLSTFKIESYTLANLPKRVRLVESANENNWAQQSSDLYNIPRTIGVNVNIYDQDVNDPTGITNFTQDYTFYFYAPEYYISPNSSTTNDPRFKPVNVDEAKKPLCLSVVGEYNPIWGDSVRLQYDIYLGEDNTDDFNIKRNRHYINTLTVCGTTNHAGETDDAYIDHRVHATIEKNLLHLYEEAANCYIIKETGSYSIPAVRGVYKVGSNLEDIPWCTGKRVAIIKTDNNSVQYSTPTYDERTHAIKIDVTSVANGNAILAIYHEDNPNTTDVDEGQIIEWSWHLWFNTKVEIAGTEVMPISNHTYPNNAVMMDRNLGASSGIIIAGYQDLATGLYYKYGHKDPFVEDDYYGGGSIYDESGDPVYDWSGDEKSITDPCPPGYRVPSSAVWSKRGEHNILLGSYQYYQISSTNLVNYPYAGEINGTQKRTTESNARDYTLVIDELKYEAGTTAYKFTNIRYPSLTKTGGTYGVLATTEPNAFQQYLNASFTISEFFNNAFPETLTYTKGTGTNVGSFLRPKYEYTYPDTPTKENVAWSSLDWTMQGRYTACSVGNTKYVASAFYQEYSADPANGYQVRCVSEDSPVK